MYDWVGKVIHWELCKRLKFGHAYKWYMQKPESVLENETHEILRKSETETDHPIPTRTLDVAFDKQGKKKQQKKLFI